jgi:hypothetical protein
LFFAVKVYVVVAEGYTITEVRILTVPTSGSIESVSEFAVIQESSVEPPGATVAGFAVKTVMTGRSVEIIFKSTVCETVPAEFVAVSS